MSTPRVIIKEAAAGVYGWTDECAYDWQTADAVLDALAEAGWVLVQRPPLRCPAEPCDLEVGHDGDHTYFEVDQ